MPDTIPALIESTTGFLRTISGNLGIAFSEALSADIGLDLDRVEAVPLQEIMGRSEDALWSVFNLNAPDASDCVLIISNDAALALIALAAGEVVGGAATTLTEADIETLGRAAAALAGGIAVGLTNSGAAAAEVEACLSNYGALSLPPMFAMEQNALEATFHLTLPDGAPQTLAFLFTPDFLSALANLTEGANDSDSNAPSATLNEAELAAMLDELEGMGDLGGASGSAAASSTAAPPFANFPTAPEDAPLSRGMELIMDIPLDVTVELGRVRMLIRDVLDLASGSIIELDRVAGEPVDLLVNGRLVAKGEVVVIEDNFGIRLTEIVSPADRVAGLGRGR